MKWSQVSGLSGRDAGVGWGVRADMATYGKVVGCRIADRRAGGQPEIHGTLWTAAPGDLGDDSFPEVGVTFFAGTFVRHPLVLASAWAVLNHIKTQGPQMQEKLQKRTSELAADLNTLFQKYGLKTEGGKPSLELVSNT